MSVCRSFFLGHIDHESLTPYPQMDPDEADSFEILRDSLIRFAEDHIDSRRIDAEARIPAKVLAGLAELGIFGITVPEEYDGYGASETFYARVFETVARLDGAIV
ncbi:MAG: acyl-CoA dehydrogenase family protein, partial [Gemmatimonadota bacterium]